MWIASNMERGKVDEIEIFVVDPRNGLLKFIPVGFRLEYFQFSESVLLDLDWASWIDVCISKSVVWRVKKHCCLNVNMKII